MTLAQRAFCELYPGHCVSEYFFSIQYSRRFSPYNANVKYFRGSKKYSFKLSHKWKGVSEDILIGLIQFLMLKALKIEPITKKTMHIEFYNSFIKNIHKYQEKNNVDPILKEIFDDLNAKYFNGLLEECNLVWGQKSVRTLGHYAYGSDTITMSTIFQGLSATQKEFKLFQYVLYHEMLHKKHKFSSTGNRHLHHSRAFREDEAKFENAAWCERELNTFIRTFRVKRFFGF